ncbi:hypothetical protein BJ508DRAFT_328216 [Ascobolus immersus RN42]|uniref:C2H2-type domain-containing protein n=1 Tax=Ascobolus immersus RN42 TaxID=1160509 RepID=A0A3N4ICQ2_ASCIM|nr:hypothetical protein BJ508DRAFT_328216 [Ascobolus immersus RN42]
MAAALLECSLCPLAFHDSDEREHHRLSSHERSIENAYYTGALDNLDRPDITLHRSLDLRFYCAIRVCDFSDIDWNVVVDHCSNHPLLFPILLKKGTVKGAEGHWHYKKKIQECKRQTFISAPTASIKDKDLPAFTSTPTGSLVTASTSSEAGSQTNPPTITQNDFTDSSYDESNSAIRNSSMNAVNAATEIKSRLRAQFLQKIHDETMRVILEHEKDVEASMNKMEQITVYYEKTMAQLDMMESES